MSEEKKKVYEALPTLKRFHESPAQIRCIVGPVGSGKTSAASMEVCSYIPDFLFKRYGITETRVVVVRNTYRELQDTTIKTILEWFSWGEGGDVKEPIEYILRYPDYTVTLWFRSCDRPQDIKKFKSLEVTLYWIDESIEVAPEVKRMLKNRIGRFPQRCPVRFGIETTNPPDVEDPTYSDFKWDTPPPGPVSAKQALKNHAGFWQPPYENIQNLRPHYYADLREDYKDSPDWIATYIEGKPGIIIQGKAVHNNFRRDIHVAKELLIWAKGEIWRGWDNSGNAPACVAIQMPQLRRIQVLREWHSEKKGIVDFGNEVKAECSVLWPTAVFKDWADPAGENQYSKKEGGFTSNAQLMREECGINVLPSEQNWTVRKESVESQLGLIDGMLIDPSCVRLINGLMGGYHFAEIDGAQGKYKDKPEKDKFSHVCEALHYVVLKMVGANPSKAKSSGEWRKKLPHGTWRTA